MDFGVLCLTALGSFAALFVFAKLIGHKQIAQLDFFDYITGITIGSIAAEMATELEEPWKPLVAMAVYGLVTVGMSLITSKWPRMRPYGEKPFVAAKAAAKTANRKHKRGVPGGVRCKGEADRVSHTATRPRKRRLFFIHGIAWP